MSKLRATAVVTAPDGSEWEIYAYKFRWRPPPRRRELGRAMVAAVRTLQLQIWTVDAVTYLPRKRVYTWRTTGEHKGQVLAQKTITALRLVAGAYASAQRAPSARLPLSSGAGNAWRVQASPIGNG